MNEKLFRKDPVAKSPSWFSIAEIAELTEETIDILLSEAGKDSSSLRLCLHTSPDKKLHNMVIFQHHNTYVEPHRNPGKEEAWQIIRGELGVIIFHPDGSIKKLVHLGGTGNPFMGRLDISDFHTMVALSEYTVFHECTTGPFNRDTDYQSANFAPGRNEGLKCCEQLQKWQKLFEK